jgi:hypothetical protein
MHGESECMPKKKNAWTHRAFWDETTGRGAMDGGINAKWSPLRRATNGESDRMGDADDWPDLITSRVNRTVGRPFPRLKNQSVNQSNWPVRWDIKILDTVWKWEVYRFIHRVRSVPPGTNRIGPGRTSFANPHHHRIEREIARDERDHTVHTGLRSWLGPLHSGPHARGTSVPSTSNTSFLVVGVAPS